MGRDDKHAASDVPEDDDIDDGESHAADEPTAVWDESALRAAGLGDIFKRREAEAATPASAPPATPAPKPSSSGDPSIVIEADVVAEQPAAPSALPSAAATPVPPPPVAEAAVRGGLSWFTTVVIAFVLGAVAYALIRLLRG